MLAISRAFGDHQLKMPNLPNDLVSNVPDVTSTELVGEDVFLLVACDGLWDVMDDQSAVNLVLDGAKELSRLSVALDQKALAEVLARMLVEEAKARGTQDNVTCLLLML